MRNSDDPTPDDGSTFDEPSTSSEGSDVSLTGFDASDAPAEPAATVLSGDMDEHDPDSIDEVDLSDIHQDLSPKPAAGDTGFDGWLDGGEAEDENPYEALAEEDDAAAEIADWMAFTSSNPPDEFDAEPEVVVDVTDTAVGDDDETGSIEDQERETFAEDEHDDTIELDLGGDGAEERQVEADAESIDGQEPDETLDEPVHEPEDTTEPDPDELLVIPAVRVDPDEQEETVAATESDEDAESDIAEARSVEETGETPALGGFEDDDSPFIDDLEDTGEIPIVGSAEPAETGDEDSGVFDFEEFTEDHYLPTATREHQDLAAAIAAAEAEDTEKVALAAAIPGLNSDVVGFDDVVEASDHEGTAAVKPPASSDLVLRVGTAVALLGAFFLSLLWRPALIVLALAAFLVAAGEFYSVLIHRGYKPVSIFGFLGIVGAGLGAVVWGVVAIPIAFAVMITLILLFDAVSRRRQGAVSGFATTTVVAVWIGGFGAFAFPIIESESYRSLVLAVVVSVALVDIAAYFVGSTIGRRPLAPVVSPKKTIEGFVGGTLMALLAGVVASFFIEPMDLPAGLVFGVVVAVFSPLGDLAVSVVKRSLNIKDMGSILPGHGGLLDRIDAIIAVVPAAWAAFAWMGLL